MTTGGNADAKRSEKVEGKECLRTVECLRGRLLAERMASRNAKEEAQLIENKLVELERKLKEETKSRSRAEKKLNFLMKKLESLNITWVSDESEPSSFLDKSEISSVSSSSVASSSTKEAEQKWSNAKVINSEICDIEDSIFENPKSPIVPVPQNLHQNVSQTWTSSQSPQDNPAAEQHFGSRSNANSPELEVQKEEMDLNSSFESHSLKSNELESSQKEDNSNMDDQSLKSSIKEEILDKEGEEEQDEHVDNSLALPVDLPKTKQRIDPAILDATVKEVLDALRHAKEKLQTSMERRRMIKVGYLNQFFFIGNI